MFGEANRSQKDESEQQKSPMMAYSSAAKVTRHNQHIGSVNRLSKQ